MIRRIISRIAAAATATLAVLAGAGPAYAAGPLILAVNAVPTTDGGFCLYFAPNPRSGPTGTDCIPRGAGADEAVFSLLAGTDGGLIFGRVGASDATTLVITFLDNTTVRTPVAEAGFFVAPIPGSATDAMMVETPPGPKNPPTKDGRPIRGLDLSLVSAISVTATDAAGNTVAPGLTSPDWVH
jgi:hypothetical protein